MSENVKTSTIQLDERVHDVQITDDTLKVGLADGRTITVPLIWYPRLFHAAPSQRTNWQVCHDGYTIHWAEIGEVLHTEELLWSGPAAHAQHTALDQAYRQMANDEAQEAEAFAWIEALVGDVTRQDEDVDEAYRLKILDLAEHVIRRYQR